MANARPSPNTIARPSRDTAHCTSPASFCSNGLLQQWPPAAVAAANSLAHTLENTERASKRKIVAGDAGLTSRKIGRDEGPSFGPVLPHKANHHVVLLLGPRSFYRGHFCAFFLVLIFLE